MQQASKVEKMLIETVIRHGGEVILPDVEDETSGQHFDLNVAQYIAYDLAQDQLVFSDPLYNRILAEAVEQSEKGPLMRASISATIPTSRSRPSRPA